MEILHNIVEISINYPELNGWTPRRTGAVMHPYLALQMVRARVSAAPAVHPQKVKK